MPNLISSRSLLKDKPESPRNPLLICSDAGNAAFFWIPGSDRGAQQKFVVTYNIPNMRAQNNYTVWGNSVTVSNLERRKYVFSLTAINVIGESKPVQASCTIRDFDKGDISIHDMKDQNHDNLTYAQPAHLI